MDTTYNLRADISLTGIYYDNVIPVGEVWLDSTLVYSGEVIGDKLVSINTLLPKGNHCIKIKLINKNGNDTIGNKDKAIVINKISFNDIHSPKIVWAGLYYPIYPPDYSAGDQYPLKYSNYLGWNGEWVLDFTIPIFTWLHNLEDLGWIYN